MGTVKDLTGKKFGRLIAMRYVFTKKRHAHWECKCICGNIIITNSNTLQRKDTQSCGCLQKEKTQYANTKHGMHKTKFYEKWRTMKQRCGNTNNNRYKDYGGRGITVCERWLKFENFRDDMYLSYKEHRLNNKFTSIDRIDNDGNYCPENCRWATCKEQQNNTRYNRLLTYKGQTLNITQWAEKLDMTPCTISTRVRRGWSVKRTLDTPTLDCNQSLQLARAVLQGR